MKDQEILKKVIEKAVESGYGTRNTVKDLMWVLKRLENKPQHIRCFIYGWIFDHSFAKAFVLYLLKEKAKFVSKRVSPEYEEYETLLQIGDEVLHPFDGFYFEDEPEDMSIEDLLKKDTLIEDLKIWFLKNMVSEEQPLKYLEKFL